MEMKPFGLILVSFFLLSFLQSPFPTFASEEEISFDDLCKQTKNVTFCKDILTDPRITETMDSKQLAAIVFDKAVEGTEKNVNFMMEMALANSAKGYLACVDGYEAAFASFKDGRSQLDKDIKTANGHAVEAKDGAETCCNALAKSGLEDIIFDNISHEISVYSDLCSAITGMLMNTAKSQRGTTSHHLWL